jgi:hypothetical protein
VPRLCSLLLVAVVAAGVAVPDARAGSTDELAQRYAPVIRLVQQKEPCHHGEPYVPTDVRRILGNPGVVLRGPWDTSNVVKVAPTARDLSLGLFEYHLDFPGNALEPGCSYDQWSHRINQGASPTTYARVVGEPSVPGRLALQYWFFYVFNDFNDKHEGDWEMIQLDFDASTPAQALTLKPALVGYSQHEGAESAHWGDSKLELVDGTHPVVYPALGSHANYYSDTLFLGRSAAQGVGCDDTTGPSRQLRPVVSLIPTAKAAYLRADPWLGYEGHWGEKHRGFYNGPTGPNTKDQWTKPLTWAKTTWRDKSFVVPEGTALGSSATDFFCGAVATASTVLTALVGNPSPLLIAFGLILALILWLTSRTRWQPSAPLRLRRRRTWGSIITSTRRMYLGHLRLFLAIGLLFLPLGLVITGAQYLIFRVGGLSPLVTTAGPSNAVVGTLALAFGVLIILFGLAIVETATTRAMVELDEGRKVTAMSAYKLALPRLTTVLAALVIAVIAAVLVSFTTIGTLLAAWLVVRWSLTAQVVALEDCGPRQALRRSAQLVRGQWWRVGSLLLFVSVIGLLLGPLTGTILLFATSASFNFINLASSVVYVLVLPYVAIAAAYLYFDLKVAEDTDPDKSEASDVLPAEA